MQVKWLPLCVSVSPAAGDSYVFGVIVGSTEGGVTRVSELSNLVSIASDFTEIDAPTAATTTTAAPRPPPFFPPGPPVVTDGVADSTGLIVGGLVGGILFLAVLVAVFAMAARVLRTRGGVFPGPRPLPLPPPRPAPAPWVVPGLGAQLPPQRPWVVQGWPGANPYARFYQQSELYGSYYA